ncbi:hypothetical protein STRMOE7_01165 [Streptomyces sp. MOE7]|nr:hypothetical protein STRMOE7_01165 [Streptomyces sp. MOE7]
MRLLVRSRRALASISLICTLAMCLRRSMAAAMVQLSKSDSFRLLMRPGSGCSKCRCTVPVLLLTSRQKVPLS